MKHPLAYDLDHVLSHTGDVWNSLRGKSLFITGGTGFVGTWLTESLVRADDKLDLGIRAVLLTRDPDAFRAKAPQVANHESVELLCGDACAFAAPKGRFDYVIHAATERYFEPTAARPASTFDADVVATRRVLDFAKEAGVRRLLFTSSGAVYGEQPHDLFGTPEDFPGAPSTMDARSAYGQAKRASEFLCSMYARQFGFDALIARLFAFVGPHLPLEGYAVGNFISDAMNGRTIRIESDGSTVRSYLYAADLAIWLWTILVRGESLRPYNVGSPQAVTVRELAETVARVDGGDSTVEVLGRPGVPATRYVPDTARAKRELGLRVLVPLEEGVRRTIEYHRTQTRLICKGTETRK